MTAVALTAAGREPDGARRRARVRVGRESPRRRRSPVRRRGGRIRPLVPRAVADGRRRHEHRGRSSRHLRRPRRHQTGVRPVRARRASRSCCAPTTPARTVSPTPSSDGSHSLRNHVAATRGSSRDGLEIARGRVQLRRRVTTTSCSVASSFGFPGRHNVLNALAALASGSRARRASSRRWRAGSASFAGAERRFQRLGERGGVLVVDDYAHHPTEIAATLAAARGAFPERRIVAAFQPHLFTRTRDFAREFGASLAAADAVFLTEIYPGARAADRRRDVGTRRRRAHRRRRTLAWRGERAELADALAAAGPRRRRRAHGRRRRHHQDGPRAARASSRRSVTRAEATPMTPDQDRGRRGGVLRGARVRRRSVGTARSATHVVLSRAARRDRRRALCCAE